MSDQEQVANNEPIRSRGLYMFGQGSSVDDPNDPFKNKREKIEAAFTADDASITVNANTSPAQINEMLITYQQEHPNTTFLFIEDHGGLGNFGDGYSIKYEDLFKQVPLGYDIFVDNCFSGTALNAANNLPPGNIVYTAVSSQSYGYTYGSQIATLQNQTADNDLTPAELFATRLATTRYNDFANNNAAENINKPEYAAYYHPSENASDIIPTKFAISGIGEIDLKDQMATMKGQDLTGPAQHLLQLMKDGKFTITPEYEKHVMKIAQELQEGKTPKDTALACAITYQAMEDSGKIQQMVDQARSQLPPEAVISLPQHHAPQKILYVDQAAAAVTSVASTVTAWVNSYVSPETKNAAEVRAEPTKNVDLTELRNAVNGKQDAIKVGSNGPAVEQLQEFLIAQGFTGKDGKPLTVDGSFGTNTQAALIDYQRANGLDADGVAGKMTLANMNQKQLNQMLASNAGINEQLTAARTENISAGIQTNEIAAAISAIRANISSDVRSV